MIKYPRRYANDPSRVFKQEMRPKDMGAPVRPNKYGNQPTIVDGIEFDSKLEAEYYSHLLVLKKNHIIDKIETQVSVVIIKPFKHPETAKTVKSTRYIADFRVTYPGGAIEYIDTKGALTDVFKIKAKLFMSVTGLPLWIVRKNGQNWVKEAVYG
nr:MAG TPA: Endonuclease [Caudoviricetes sp.]